jgi:internalin A
LDATKYPDEAVHFLLGLLERFELSFALNDNARRILVPQLLADRQPEEVRDFRPAGCLNFGYEYPVLPEGLLPRFVVRTHHLSQNETRWKSGVILQHGNRCRALVRAEAAARQVRIHVTGEESDRRDLLAIIRHNFDVIHREYKLDAKELVYAREAPERELSVTELQTLRDAGEHARILVVNGKVLKPEIDPLLQDVEESGVIPLQLFLSYAHEDAKYVERLRKNLKVMERNGLIGIWYDRELYAGQQWKPEILRELNDADAIICQLSPDFLASDFCLLTELAAAIRRQTAGEAALIAYVLRTCGWKRVDQLSGFQLLPSEAKPLRDWRDPDRYWEAIVDGIETALGKLQRSPRFRARRKREHSVRDPTR